MPLKAHIALNYSQHQYRIQCRKKTPPSIRLKGLKQAILYSQNDWMDSRNRRRGSAWWCGFQGQAHRHRGQKAAAAPTDAWLLLATRHWTPNAAPGLWGSWQLDSGMPSVTVSTSEPPARYEGGLREFPVPRPCHTHTLFTGGSKFSPRCILLWRELVLSCRAGYVCYAGLLQNFMITRHPSKYIL